MSKNKEMIIISIASLWIVLITYFLTKIDEDKIYTVFELICIFTWSYSLIPSYVMSFRFISKMNILEGSRIGYMLGSLFLTAPIIIAPYGMIRYYNSIIKKD